MQPMPDALPAPGLVPDVALWRLLSLRGIDLPLMQLREESSLDGSLETMQHALARHGLDARGVRIEGLHDLAALETPTLLQSADGSWLLLRARHGRQAVVEGAGGVSRHALAALAPHLSGHALELTPGLPDGSGVWPRLRTLLPAYRGTLIQFALASVALQLFALLTPELTGLVVGRALPDSAPGLLHLVAAAVVVAAVFSGAIGWLRERTVLYLLTRLEVALKRGLLEHVLRLPFPELQRRTLGELLQSFHGIASARSLLAERLLGVLMDGVLAVGFLVLMGIKALAPTLVLMAVVLAMAGIAVLVGRAQARLQAAEVTAQARQRGYLAELIAGIRTVKAAGAERDSHMQWLGRFRSELDLNLRRSRVGLWNEVGLQTIRQAASMTLLVWGGYLVMQGELGIGTLFSFMLLAEGFLNAMQNLINTYLLLVMASQQLKGATELLGVRAMPRPTGRGGALSGPIVMKDVWFRYGEDRPWILQDYNVRIEPGDHVPMSGPSGSGKSTVLRLLAGLYVPDRGTVTIAGRDVRSAPVLTLYLPQFIHLKSGSIMDNLRSLSGNAPSRRIEDAAAQTGFDKVIDSMPMGYHTPMPDGGPTLSGGQRQLLALTAAVASDCSLLLLDEPMANIDALTRTHVSGILAGLQRTIISAGHV